MVLAQQDEHHKLVSSWLGVSKRVGSVTAVRNEQSLLRHLISGAACHLCIVVVENREQTLPACTLHYPDMRLLVLSVSRKTGKLSNWLQQGATDAISLQRPVAAQHAIGRLIDECVTQLTTNWYAARVNQLEKEITNLKSSLKHNKRSFAITASNDTEHTSSELNEADLNCIKEPVIQNIPADHTLEDSETDTQFQPTVMARLQKLLHTEIKAPRFTAMLVRILTEKPNPDIQDSDTSVQELTLSRAKDALRNQMQQGTILDQVNSNALLLIQSSDIEPTSRDAANRVREWLGSLDGLIDSDKDVRINTMSLPAKTRISVDEVVARLEAH